MSTQLASSQVAPAALDQSPEEYTGPRLLIQAPDAISEMEISRFLDMLQASDEQRLYLDQFYREYVGKASSLKSVHGTRMLATSIEGGKANSPYYSPEGIRAQQSLCDMEQEYIDGLRTLDNALIDRIGSILGPSQVDNVERIRWRRKRDCCGLAGCLIPSAKIDLTRLLDALGDEDIWIPAAEEARRYESGITPLFAELDKEFRRTIVRFMAVCMDEQVLFRDRPPDLEIRRVDILRQRAQLLRSQAQLQRRIADMNDRHVHLIAATLPDNAPEEFLHAYQAMAYPGIYPDHLDPANVVNTVLAREETGTTRIDEFIALRQEFSEKRLIVLRQMEKEFNDWRERFAESMSSGGPAQEKYTARMRGLREDLWRIDQAIINAMFQTIPAAEQAPEVLEYKRATDFILNKAKADRFPGA